MGRPREHRESTRDALRAAAERIVAAEGYGALSVRAVAQGAGTTTRAVYSVFGSKEGLVDTLAASAFDFLYETIDSLPETADPAADLVDVGVLAVRRLALEHPALYRIAFQRVVPRFEVTEEVALARGRAFTQLQARIGRLEDAGLLGDFTVDEATVAFESAMEGLANAELRAGRLPILPAGREVEAWRRTLWNVIRGFGAGAAQPAAPEPRW
jgi:AcrR family transcriptional regulator